MRIWKRSRTNRQIKSRRSTSRSVAFVTRNLDHFVLTATLTPHPILRKTAERSAFQRSLVGGRGCETTVRSCIMFPQISRELSFPLSVGAGSSIDETVVLNEGR